MTVGDTTLFPKHRAPFLARADRFEKWYEREKDNPVYRQRADELINVNRADQDEHEASLPLTAHLAGERKKGAKSSPVWARFPLVSARHVMAAFFGKHDDPVDLLYPEDREHCRAFVQNGDWPIPDEETRRKAAYRFAYMETPDVTTRNHDVWRPSTNDTMGAPTFRPERVEQLLREGDPELERAAARILERFEGPFRPAFWVENRTQCRRICSC